MLRVSGLVLVLGFFAWVGVATFEVSAEEESKQRTVGVILYPGFELLDVYGPVEMWSYVPGFKVVFVAREKGPVKSAQGPVALPDFSFADCPQLDILMVPGGMGTMRELQNESFLGFLRERHAKAEITTSVCSGSALLAKAGILDGHKATSNKVYFDLAVRQSDKVEWIRRARWVDDGKVVTSSGVTAGMDMALHLVKRLYGEAMARRIASMTEYVWNEDPDDDPFAKGR